MTTVDTIVNMDDFRDCYFTGPGTVAGRYMRLFWHPIFRSEDLKLGWAQPVQIMNEEFTLYRSEAGNPHLVDYRCAHRGVPLTVGWIEGECIRCRFHGWKYDSSGQCIEQPAEDESFAAKVRLRSFPVKEYLGLIFAYFGEDTPPEFSRYPEFENKNIWIETYIRPCNFLNNIENDPIHIPFTHRESEFFINRPVEIPAVSIEETEYGILLRSDFKSGRYHVTHHGMPNVLCFRRGGDRDHLAFRVPIDDDQHVSFQVDVQFKTGNEADEAVQKRHAARSGNLGRSPNEVGAAVLKGKVRIQDIEGDEKANIVWIQDYAVQVGQGPVRTRKKEWLGRSDKALILQRKIWERELKALAEGRPIKRWVWTERLAAIGSYNPL
jgi:5,5'-dehydrodivanillate O-demethylase